MLNSKEQADIHNLVVITQKEYVNRLRSNNNSIYAINLMSDLQLKIDDIVSRAKYDGVRFGCDNGCSHCCTLRVEALAPEVFYIAKKLKQKYSEEHLFSLIEKLKDYSSKAKGLSQIEHLIPCPLLSKGRCTIYEFRPAMCRKYNSLDAEVCKDPYGSVPEHMGVALESAAKMQGAMTAYSSKKLSAAPHELGQALLIALTDSDSEKRWFKGAHIFDPLPD
ncbi:YkgJ family cysteine cluster protein [Rheinheimera aquimaris]|jgi:Fe-S-cluster containining protein|uniref:YkgJ family cysteine cluster protein n=1 Tax=Rheinheimera aquimaris TaxID=412437 RepID=UPI0010647A60|nr:YkgJ family cysteine cluster protein [Rheinheimera aquimaris]MBU2062300.1 YkgJ family cysteine cluster protein [Bacteroidota bacterium]